MDEASLAQFRAATTPSRRVAHLRHVRDCVIKRDADPRNRGASARRVTIGGVATSSAGGATPLKIKTFEQHDPPSQIQQTAEEATSSTLYDAAAFATPAAS